MSMHPSSPPQLTGGPPRRTPADMASLVAEYVRSGIRIVFWILAAATAISFAYFVARLLLFGLRLGCQALSL